jgi:hypothetical protein
MPSNAANELEHALEMPGRKPFGYYRGEAEIIAKMEALREAGLGFDSIADRLNAADVPSRSGKLWSGIVINRILTRGATQIDPPEDPEAPTVTPQHSTVT